MESNTVQKMKMGALMGGTVGLCVGFVFGTVSLIRFGGGKKGSLTLLSQYMLGSAASFGFFMSIGSVIRTEGRPMSTLEWQTQSKLPVVIHQQNKSAKP
ncbi:reactive mitochondrial oxygen species modulator 1-domain-containing protein [Spinellus fusiger]|nr:reactive mitochondrial oxygen species modulator 1-domain-containing protein [Spinellus fusiger]